jgi:hypothetical protein
MKTLGILLLLLFAPCLLTCSTIPVDAQLVASYESAGLYNLLGLGTWNGQPVSPTNTPSDLNRYLGATMNLSVANSSPNELFVQVSDVTTTIGAYWTGAAFENVTQSGVSIGFPSSLGSATLGLNYATFGESLANGLSGTEIDSSLTNTPGYGLAINRNTYFIATTDGAELGLSSLNGIYGAERIHGGGVFALTFDASVDLRSINYSVVDVYSLYGANGTNQAIPGIFQQSIIPEPASVLLIIGGFCLLKLRGYKCKTKHANRDKLSM